MELYHRFPNTPAWRGAQLKNTGTTLPLHFTRKCQANIRIFTEIRIRDPRVYRV